MRWIDNRPPPLEPIAIRVADNRPRDGSDVPRHALPDLTDPATLGCLLALVREAYGSKALYVRLSDGVRASDGIRAWEVIGWLDPSRSPNGRGGSFCGWGYASEAETLVATLEAAP